MDYNIKEMYDVFNEYNYREPNTPIEISIWYILRNKYILYERFYVSGRMNKDSFIKHVNRLNANIYRLCKDLNVCVDDVLEPSITGRYLKPKKLNKRIDIEKYIELNYNVFKQVEDIFKKIKTDNNRNDLDHMRDNDIAFIRWF